ncbi:MAG: hypothetical protein QNJ45_02985 [Ardenticatenaceae bacterium]|nr:hypothetical protein [Ardenticatenaceae bacterium]
MSKQKKQSDPLSNELERLRDILYGEYARDTASQLTVLEAQLLEFRQQTHQSLESQSNAQANQLEVTRQDIEDKLTKLTNNMNQEFAKLRKEMSDHIARIEEAMTNRRVLGQLLSDLSTELMSDRDA